MKVKSKKKERLTPEQLDANYAKFMDGKELDQNGRELFDRAIKKAATSKQHGSK